MANFSVVDAAKAPKPPAGPGRLTKRMQEYEGYVLGVKKGQVGKVTPGEGETARGEALRISRAAKRAGRTVNTWVVDGVVYFSVE